MCTSSGKRFVKAPLALLTEQHDAYTAALKKDIYQKGRHSRESDPTQCIKTNAEQYFPYIYVTLTSCYIPGSKMLSAGESLHKLKLGPHTGQRCGNWGVSNATTEIKPLPHEALTLT